jgi:hypothetical protein
VENDHQKCHQNVVAYLVPQLPDGARKIIFDEFRTRFSIYANWMMVYVS